MALGKFDPFLHSNSGWLVITRPYSFNMLMEKLWHFFNKFGITLVKKSGNTDAILYDDLIWNSLRWSVICWFDLEFVVLESSTVSLKIPDHFNTKFQTKFQTNFNTKFFTKLSKNASFYWYFSCNCIRWSTWTGLIVSDFFELKFQLENYLFLWIKTSL